jgi:hypothetical protein
MRGKVVNRHLPDHHLNLQGKLLEVLELANLDVASWTGAWPDNEILGMHGRENGGSKNTWAENVSSLEVRS